MKSFVLLPVLLALVTASACAQESDTSRLRGGLSGSPLLPFKYSIDTVHTKAGDPFVVHVAEGIDPRFEPIIDRLVEEKGWERDYVEAIFADHRTVFIPKLAIVKPRKKVTEGDWYSWVDTKESSNACINFIGQYDTILTKAEEKFSVDKEVIASLLRCETKHGTVTGDYHVLSVYASMALMPEAWVVEENVENAERQMSADGKSRKEITAETTWIKERSQKRGSWAFKELDHLLRIHKSGTWDVRDLYGSWAGAFGWSQFLPSSYRNSAVDGDADGKIDLYNPADVIFSVANYLSKSGYRSGNAAKIKKALRSYNPSTPYVESIYALSRRVTKETTE